MAGRGPFREFTAMFIAVSLLGTSAASAAPTPRSIDPLVALSIFGTAQSRAALCAAGASSAAAAGAAAAAQAPGSGCVLPVVDAPPPVAAEAPPPLAAVAPAVVAESSVSAIPLLLGLAAIAAIAIVVLKHNDSSGEIDLPISP